MQINNNHKTIAGWVLRLIILVVCGWVIWTALADKWNFDFEFSDDQMNLILLVVALMTLNWALEVWRWKMSLDSVEPSSWREAGRQVFSGLALNWIMPFASGDLLARVLPNANKKRVALLIVYNRLVMLSLTTIFGIYGIFIFSEAFLESFDWALFVGSLAVFFAIIAVGIWLKPISIRTCDWLYPVAVTSIFRYLVFTTQFMLLFYAFMPEVSLMVIFAGVGWTFFFRSVIPSLFGNLGVREVGALVFFESFVSEIFLILIPSLLIWLINTVAPSILGLYYILRFKN